MSAEVGSPKTGLRDLFGHDRLAEALGIEFVSGGTGMGTLAMTVGPKHLNFLGGCHGGAIFTLADAAFGVAANSHGAVAIGIDTHIAYTNPAAAGDRLIAHASELNRSAKVATYRVTVEKEDGTLVANFTGTVYLTGRAHS